jgi:RHS repeat-associated protein
MVRAESITATLVYTYNADGLRVAQAQSVSSVQSVDTFTWDWATGVPEMLSDGNSLYLIGYDTLGWQNGNDWAFVLPDALGSVRQETDADGVVTSAREWSPYGVEIGGTQEGLGFTGEWFDANVGLMYLRARWYDDVSGRFTQKDPLDTAAFYRYANDNPLRFTDPSGLIPEYDLIGDIRDVRAELRNGQYIEVGYQYSCNCGWIDWGHAISGMLKGTSLASQILSRLKGEVDWGLYRNWTGERGIRVTSYDPIWGTQPLPGLDRVAVVSEDKLHLYSTYIGGNIFMAQSKDYEAFQSWGTKIVGGQSDFSEEDLPSNWIGFYMASRMEQLGGDEKAYDKALDEIINLCDLKDAEESKDIYKNEYLNGGGFVQGWRYFHPRLIKTWRSLSKCPNDMCEKPSQWPTEFRDLYNNSLRFGQEGNWWRWTSIYPGLKQTPLEGVFAVTR